MRSIVPGCLASAAASTLSAVAPVTGVPPPGPPTGGIVPWDGGAVPLAPPGGGAPFVPLGGIPPPCWAAPGGIPPATAAVFDLPFDAIADAPNAIAASAAMPAAALRTGCDIGDLPVEF